MSVLIPIRSSSPQIGKFAEISIVALNAKFIQSTGTWSDLSMINSARACENELSKEKAIEANIQNELAKTNILLDRLKKEIRMILSDKTEVLERKGFPASDLLLKINPIP